MESKEEMSSGDRKTRTADLAYILFVLGPVVGFALILQSPLFSGNLTQASPQGMTVALIGLVVMLLLLLVGSALALLSRWHRPLLFLGVYAVALSVFMVLSNLFGFARGDGAGEVLAVIGAGIAVVVFPVCAVILAVLWFARWRPRVRRNDRFPEVDGGELT